MTRLTRRDRGFEGQGGQREASERSEHPHTAIAELCFHRLLFFAELPDTPWPGNAGEYTAFAAYLTQHPDHSF